MYIFTLDNGEVATARSSSYKNDDLLGECKELAFRYPNVANNPLSGSFSAISITSPDGKVVFFDLIESKSECIGRVWIFSILLLVWLSLFVFLFVCNTMQEIGRNESENAGIRNANQRIDVRRSLDSLRSLGMTRLFLTVHLTGFFYRGGLYGKNDSTFRCNRL